MSMNRSVPSEWKVLVSLFTNNIVQMFSHVVNITVLSVNITWCKLWQQFGWQLLYWRLHFLCMPYIYFKSTNLHITVCGILIERDCFKMFELLRIWSITLQPLQGNDWQHYFIWDAPLFLASSVSSSVLPMYPSMHPYSSSFSRPLTLMVFWMFIQSWDAPLSYFRELVYNWLIYILLISEGQDSHAQFMANLQKCVENMLDSLWQLDQAFCI